MVLERVSRTLAGVNGTNALDAACTLLLADDIAEARSTDAAVNKKVPMTRVFLLDAIHAFWSNSVRGGKAAGTKPMYLWDSSTSQVFRQPS